MFERGVSATVPPVRSLEEAFPRFRSGDPSTVRVLGDVRERAHAFAQQHVRGAMVADGLAELQVRYPNVPIVHCDSRKLAEEWTYRFLAAAHSWARDEPAARAHARSSALEGDGAAGPA